MSCNTNLPNIGSGDCPFSFEEIKMVGFTSYKKEDGTLNSLTTTTVALQSTFAALFDKYNFSVDKLAKVVVTPVIYAATPEQGDPNKYENMGYVRKTSDGDYTISFMVEEANPDMVKQLKKLEDIDTAVYLFDEGGRVAAKKSGTNVYPVRVTVDVQNIILASHETPEQSLVTLKLKRSADVNDLSVWQMLDSSGNNADIYDESQFFSLNNATGVVTSPAVTGCQVIITDNRYNNAITGVVFGEVVFRDQSDNSTISLAASSSITESPDGTYVINEAVLLTSGKTYTLEISHSGADIVCDDVVIP